MSPALANFLFEAANFLLLAVALGWVLFRPVRRALDDESERYAKEQEELGRMRAEAESLGRKQQTASVEAEREASERRGEIIAAAQKEASRILEETRAHQAVERRAREEEAKAARDAEAAALAETVGRIAAESVARLLASLEGPSLDAALIRAACEQLRTLPPAARDSALVESAHPLDGEARTLLEAVLGGGFQERTVQELRAGVRVTTSAGQVDATALSLAREAARAVSAAGSDRARSRGSSDG